MPALTPQHECEHRTLMRWDDPGDLTAHIACKSCGYHGKADAWELDKRGEAALVPPLPRRDDISPIEHFISNLK